MNKKRLKNILKRHNSNSKKNNSNFKIDFLSDDYIEIADFEFSSFYNYSQNKSEDFFNIIDLDKDILFYIANISKENDNAQNINNFFKSVIKKFFNKHSEFKPSPAVIIKYISSEYHKKSFSTSINISILLGLISIENNELLYSNAGKRIKSFLVNNNVNILDLNTNISSISSKKNNELKFSNNDIKEYNIYLNEGDSIVFLKENSMKKFVQGGDLSLNEIKNEMKEYNNLPSQFLLQNLKRKFDDFKTNMREKSDLMLMALQRKSKRESYFMKNVCSHNDELSNLKKNIRNFLYENCRNLVKINEMMIGIHELIINAIEHGNKNDPSKNIFILIEVYNNLIKIVVRDEGLGFKWNECLNSNEMITKMDSWKKIDRGWGIPLIQEAFDGIVYNNCGNQVTVYRKFKER